LILLASNYAYKNMLYNYVCQLKMINISKYLVVALDPQINDHARSQGHPVLFLGPEYDAAFEMRQNETGVESAMVTFGTKQFTDLSMRKLLSTYVVLRHGYDVLFSDVDIAIRPGLLEALETFSGDIVSQTNQPNPADPVSKELNSGFYLARANRRVLRVIEVMIRYYNMKRAIKKADGLHDQKMWNKIINRNCTENGTEPVTCAPHTSEGELMVNVTILPRDSYRPGSSCLKNNKMVYSGFQVCHMNWVRGYAKKMDYLVRSKSWYLDAGARKCMSNPSDVGTEKTV